MPPIPDWLLHPFALGLYPGLLLALYLRIQLSLARRDLRSKERSQISQISALTETLQKLRDETKSLETERENLRVKIQSLSQKPEHQRLRHLEILLRAEQRLTVTAPGFAPAWQTAKNEALSELESEERGKSMPRQVLAQLLNSGAAVLEKLRPTATLHASGSGPEESGPKA
jgi:predicted membrane metal-binding protein